MVNKSWKRRTDVCNNKICELAINQTQMDEQTTKGKYYDERRNYTDEFIQIKTKLCNEQRSRWQNGPDTR